MKFKKTYVVTWVTIFIAPKNYFCALPIVMFMSWTAVQCMFGKPNSGPRACLSYSGPRTCLCFFTEINSSTNVKFKSFFGFFQIDWVLEKRSEVQELCQYFVYFMSRVSPQVYYYSVHSFCTLYWLVFNVVRYSWQQPACKQKWIESNRLLLSNYWPIAIFRYCQSYLFLFVICDSRHNCINAWGIYM